MDATKQPGADRPETGSMRTTYLTDEQLEHFRQRILAMRRETVDQLAQIREQLAEGGESEDDEEGMFQSAEIDHDMLSRLNTRAVKQLEALDRALKRIDAKTYGMCRVTGRPIPVERLEALPYTDTTLGVEPEGGRRG